jgi:hypothetical protein
VGTVSAPVLCEPLVALVPLQPPEAVHEVALVELHVSMEAPPTAMDIGFAVNITVAAPEPEMVTLAVAIVLAPPAPLQTNEYDVVAVSAPVLWVPLVALAPLQPPEAVHEVALVELHVSVDAPPLATEVGDALMDAVGVESIGLLLLPPPQAAINKAAQAGATRKISHRKDGPAPLAIFNRHGCSTRLGKQELTVM